MRNRDTVRRLARALWIAWAVIVWNVVFDHAIVVAGRDYIAAARRAAAAPAGPFASMDDWMRPAVTRGFWMATAAGGANVHSPNIALTHSSVPGGLDLTGSGIDCDAVVDAVVDQN